MKNGDMALECIVFYIVSVAAESKLDFWNDRESNSTLEILLELDEKLRIGTSPGHAIRSVMGERDLESLELENRIRKLSQYSWMLEKQMRKEMDFDYLIFHRILKLLIDENHWKGKIARLVSKNRMQMEIMIYLPLIIELLLIKELTFDLLVYSLSIALLLVSNTVTYVMYGDLGV